MQHKIATAVISEKIKGQVAKDSSLADALRGIDRDATSIVQTVLIALDMRHIWITLSYLIHLLDVKCSQFDAVCERTEKSRDPKAAAAEIQQARKSMDDTHTLLEAQWAEIDAICAALLSDVADPEQVRNAA